MTVIFTTEDAAPGNIVEAAIDGFQVRDGMATALDEELTKKINFTLYPNPVTNEKITLSYDLSQLPGQGRLSFEIYDLLGARLAHYELGGSRQVSEFDFPYSQGVYLGVLKWDGQVLASQKVVR